MYGTKKKKSAYTVFQKNESGYTFASLLLSLTIILITMPVIILLLQIVQFEPDDSHTDAHQFFNFLHSDALEARKIAANQTEDTLYLWKEAEHNPEAEAKVSVEQYGDHIRRRVGGQGHEIYLRNINTFHVSSVSYGVRVKVIMENGEEYEKTIAHSGEKE